jgi:hypothetical protein
MIGVLNNLTTLAWLPWMVLAAGSRRTTWIVPGLAVTTALAWLAGEPQLWALGVAMAIAAAPRPRVLVGLGLGVALVAVQLVPFTVWIAEGDRGPGAVDDLLRGHLVPADWLGLVHPAMSSGARMVFAESLFVSAPILVLMILGARRRPWVAVGAAALVVIATLPAVGAGQLYLTLTLGLVRYPSRFAMVGVAMLLPLAALGWRPWLEGRGRAVAIGVVAACAVAVIVSPDRLRVWLSLLPAATVAIAVTWPGQRALRAGSVAVGIAAMVAAAAALVDLGPSERLTAGTAWPEARGAGRVWSPAPDAVAMTAIVTDFDVRRTWPMGYLNLRDGVAVADTPAPVTHRALRRHLQEVGRGPVARWWLDALGVRLVVLPPGSTTPADFVRVTSRAGFGLWHNAHAIPVGRRAAVSPSVGSRPTPQPALTVVRRRGGALRIDTLAADPGVMWLPVTPISGWRWTLDGRRVVPVQGPGVVQSLEVPAGSHRVEAHYHPSGLTPAVAVSLSAALAVAMFSTWSFRRSARYDAANEGGP